MSGQMKMKVYQNLWEAAKAVLRGKCIARNANLRKPETSKIT